MTLGAVCVLFVLFDIDIVPDPVCQRPVLQVATVYDLTTKQIRASIKNVFFYFRPESCGWPWQVQGWDQNLLPPQKRATIYIARLDTINRFPSRIWAFHVAVAVRILVPGPETSSRSLSSKVYTVKPALHFLEDDAIVRGYVIAQEVDILLYSATCTRKAIRIFFSAQ